MPPWLFVWIGRIFSGERMEKAKPADYRYWYGVLFLSAVFVVGARFVASPSVDRIFFSSALRAWLTTTGIGLACFLITLLWGKSVPAKISLALGILAWAALAWRGSLWLYGG